ncbi:hypothetical protein Hypma_014630, partial [Hypsizygus marmoreus]
ILVLILLNSLHTLFVTLSGASPYALLFEALDELFFDGPLQMGSCKCLSLARCFTPYRASF